MTKRKVYKQWSCPCGTTVRTEVEIAEAWCSRTLACRKANREVGGRRMVEVKR